LKLELKKKAAVIKEKTQRTIEVEKVLNNYLAVENREKEANEGIVLDYKLTQIEEFQRVLDITKKKLTIGPLLKEGSCSICYEKLAHFPTERWQCGHSFCLPCSQAWQDNNPGGATCPTCRKIKPKNEKEFPRLNRK